MVVFIRANQGGSVWEEEVVVVVVEEEEEEQAVFIRGVNEEEVVVFTRENRGASAQYATRATPTISSHEEEAVLIRDSIASGDVRY